MFKISYIFFNRAFQEEEIKWYENEFFKLIWQLF